MTTDALTVFPTVVLCVFVFVRKNGLRRISVGSPTSAALRGGLRLAFARAVPTVGVPSALSVRPPRRAVGFRGRPALRRCRGRGRRCARSRRGRAVGCRLRAAHAAPFVRHEGDEGLAREVVRCEEGRDGRCDGRPPAGRTDVDHVVSPGVGQVGFQRRTVVRGDLAPGLIDDGRGTPRGRASAGRFRRDRHPWPQRSVRPRRACCRCGKSRPPALFYRSAPFGRRRSRRQRRGW